MKPFLTFARWLHHLTLGLAFLALFLCLCGQAMVVLLRYGFSFGFPWLSDMASWSFAAFVMLAIPVALAADGHVRIDIFRERQTGRQRIMTDYWATCLLLVPLACVIVETTWPQAVAAYAGSETSLQAGGLPGHWAIRLLPAIAFILAVVQAVARFAASRNDE